MSISRPPGSRDTSRDEADEVVGRLPHGRDDDDDVVTVATGACDVVGHCTDPVGVGDRGPAELLDEEAHTGRRYQRPGLRSEGIPRDPSAGRPRMTLRRVVVVDSPAVTSADKRARKRENKAAAKEARQEAQRRAQRRKRLVRAGVVVVIFAGLVGVLSLTRGDDEKGGDKKADDASSTTTPGERTSRYTAVITTNFGVIEVALDDVNAPIATEQFVKLARDGFYDGLTWHRAATDFVIQGGDPDGNGTGGSGSSVVGEVPTDNYPLGSIAAAKAATDPAGSFDSQFFIVTGSGGATLPNDYARFGIVVAGLDVAQAIEALAPAAGDGPPTEPATIDSVEIIESDAPVATTAAEGATTTTSEGGADGATTTATAAPTTTAG